jgi:dTDP-4-dehydrorhamnose 3,5-epimerase
MHYQEPPHLEVKVVRCLRGAIYDVIVDLRKGSPTAGKWKGFLLDQNNRHQLYIPAGFAHGFQALSDDVEVSYLISQFYVPEASRGVRYDDPALGITWPLPVSAISEKDKSWPVLSSVELLPA